MERDRRAITDEGAKQLAIVILKQAIQDWNSEIKKPSNTKPIYELRHYFREKDCAIHCALADIDQEQLNIKLEQMRKAQLKLHRKDRPKQPRKQKEHG